jgi:hypothetical protein
MIQKDVYILYPAGYSGSYISWAISISDLDSRSDTVRSPINTNTSTKYGGSGTSHLHIRIPTHQEYDQQVAWQLRNRPQGRRIYITNQGQHSLEENINHIFQHSDAVVIHVHDNNDPVIISYGQINMATKWPTMLVARAAALGQRLTFDPFTETDSVEFRNFMVTEELKTSGRIDHQKLQELNLRSQNWFEVRKKYQPHEVIDQHYARDYDYTNRVFELSCVDVAQTQFVDIFNDIMTRSNISDSYDLAYVQKFHHNYCAAQKNLQWFDSLQHWSDTGELDPYLLSHSAIQAQIIKEIFRRCEFCGIEWPEADSWSKFYAAVRDPSWPDCELESDISKLPQYIQHELAGNLHDQSHHRSSRLKRHLSDHWRQMSLQDINHLYQTQILGSKV